MLTIGEFSKLSSVSARMLRHYDLIGLLRPINVGEGNRYRYYDHSQLPIMDQIESLKNYGFSLEEIKELIHLPQAKLAERIHIRRIEAYKELNNLRGNLRQMEDEIIRMEGSSMLEQKYKIIIMEAPAQKVFCLRKKINIAETHFLFEELLEELKARGLKRTGVTQLMYMGDEFSYENMDVEAQVEVEQDVEGVRVIPAMTVAATTHVGPYESIKYAYDAIADWLRDHAEYQEAGPSIERYLVDEGMTQSTEDIKTGVIFPIKKV